ncbi:hypothetical protein [Qipengyuania atrilutea]|uniref:Uncharacterized protein n=1 Tax=Qipengyuania atrilutea TaxID=2744473 RepID=A0A850H280_9SPHN|nr:hypothetical protein [Actirhodobacter atriluteus]NVD44018.1 hypothetical protein [Actirhodobacter atriluteus]
MRLFGWTGLTFLVLGVLLREYFYSNAVLEWMNEAYRQGANTYGSGAPMNYFHQNWLVSQTIEMVGIAALVCQILGVGLVGYALAKMQR